MASLGAPHEQNPQAKALPGLQSTGHLGTEGAEGMKKLYKATFPVGIRSCTLIFDPTTHVLEAEWTPSRPGKDMLTDPVRMQQYRDGRDKLLAEVGADLGGSVIVAEV
jgi:hypothetical protein